MKIFIKIFLSIIILISFIVCDILDRTLIFSHQPKFEKEDLMPFNINENIQNHYSRFFNNPKYSFPRKEVSRIKLYKNHFLISRLTSQNIPVENNQEWITLFNDPNNFQWGETTWDISESEYILRFFDSNENEIGKIWLCIKDCKVTKSLPFSPNMKFGGLNKKGIIKLNRLINALDH